VIICDEKDRWNRTGEFLAGSEAEKEWRKMR